MKLLEWCGDVYQVPDWVDEFTWECDFDSGRYLQWPEYAEFIFPEDSRAVEFWSKCAKPS